MSPETIVALTGGILAVIGSVWRIMATLSGLERKVDQVSAKLDLHVIDRLSRVESEVAEIKDRLHVIDRDLAHRGVPHA